MAEELKACRNCGGKCDPTGWLCGDGRRGPECEGCGITAPDVDSWNRLMGGQVADGVAEPACSLGAGCNCGGDLPRVREGCANWVPQL